MIRFRQLSGLAAVLLCLFFNHAVNGLGISDRELHLQLGPRDRAPLEPGLFEMKQSGDSSFGAMPLSGRDLIASWLGKRDCVDPGYVECVSM
jgi:hypothetical protein